MHLPRGLPLLVYTLYRRDVVLLSARSLACSFICAICISLVRRGTRFTASGDRRGSLDL